SNHFFREVVRKLLAQGHSKDNLGIIFPNGQYRNFYKSVLPHHNVCYLYNYYNDVYKQVQEDKKYTVVDQGFADNAFMILASDKQGLRNLEASEQLNHIETIYRIYSEFLDRFLPDCIVFPDIEVVDGYVLYSIAKARNIPIAYSYHLRNLGLSIFGSSITESFPPYFGLVTPEGSARAEAFKQQVKTALPKPSSFTPDWHDDRRPDLKSKSGIVRLLQSFALRLGPERYYRGEDNYMQKIKIALLPWLEKYRAFKYSNLVQPHMQIRTFGNLPEHFHLFALQVTPESSINYLMPYYVDQIRAIDEIRMALPAGRWLVVKEHPAMRGVRPARFYRALRKMPGVLLADANLPMAQFLPQAEMLYTITGTVGLECLLSKKPCYMFGKNFFAQYLPNKDNAPDLKQLLTHNLEKVMAEKYDAFISDLPKIFTVAHSFILAEAASSPYMMTESNITAFIAAIEDHFGKIESLRQAA
ncbi:MAG: hypothetical protein JWP32_2962, partial [Schumannella sp.]|nr:hypothetical protein [Schumannella sp.]